MDPVSASVTIARPREEVFEYLADVANHAEFCDHYLVDWRLTREDSYGRGAGARFRVTKRRLNRFPWADVVFAEVERPRLIVETGRAGKFNRIRTLGTYELEQGSGDTTRVTFTFESEPGNMADRMRPISLPSFATFLAIAAALTLSACGNKTTSIHGGETEGVYVDVGPLK